MKKAFPFLLVLLLVAAAFSWYLNDMNSTAIVLIVLFMSTAWYSYTYQVAEGASYTLLIFAVLVAALSFPQFFVRVGDFETSRAIVPLLIIIMFGMGTTMSFNDFKGVLKMPKGVIIGIACQYTIMPGLGYILAISAGLPKEIAAGVILIGCSPSGLASNVMSYISKSNLALSITLTAIVTLISPIVTPFLMQLLANEFIPIDPVAMFWSIMKIVIFPIIGGLLFHHFTAGRLVWLEKAMPLASMIAIGMVISIVTASGRDSLLSIGFVLLGVVIVHNLVGYGLGYKVSRWAGMDKPSSRTIAFEVGMQNAGLASGIAIEMGKVATMGLAAAVFGPVMNITGSSLAAFWKRTAKNQTD